MGKRSHDSQAFALCTQCHRRFHDGSWEFRKWVKAFRREWQELAVVETRARYLNRHKDPWGNLPTHDKSANTSPPPDDSATTSH